MNPDFEPEERVIRHVDEFLKLMSVMTGDHRYEKMLKDKDFQEEIKKGEVTLCKVLDYREAKGEAEGISKEKNLQQCACSKTKGI